MSIASIPTRHGWLTLAADGALLTAGAFAVMTGAAVALDALGMVPLGQPGRTIPTLLSSLLSGLLQVGGFVVGPVITWWLHRYRFATPVTVPVIGGFVIGGALVWPVVMFGAIVNRLVASFSPVENVGAIGYSAFVALAFLAVLVWLDLGAVYDLSPTRREHVLLDVGRLTATVAVAALAATAIAMTMAGADAREAGVLLLTAGVHGAAVVAVADVIAHEGDRPPPRLRALRRRNASSHRAA